MKIQDIRIGQKVLDGDGRVHEVKEIFSDGTVRDQKGDTLFAKDLGPVTTEPYIQTGDDGTVSLRLEVEQGILKADIETAGEFGRNSAYLGFLPKGTDIAFDLFTIRDNPEDGDPGRDIRIICWGGPFSLEAESDETLFHEEWEGGNA